MDEVVDMAERSKKQAEQLERDCLMLRTVNSDLVTEIEALGGGVDLGTARVEHLMGFLVEQGILTEVQMWSCHKEWEQSLKQQLIPVRDRLKAMHKERAEQQRRSRMGKPITPPEKKLWTPGQ